MYISDIKLFPKKTISLFLTFEILISCKIVVSPKPITCIGILELLEYNGLLPLLYIPSVASTIEDKFLFENLE